MNSFAGTNVWDSSYWIFFAGPFLASFVAAGIYKFIFAEESEEEEAPAATDSEVKNGSADGAQDDGDAA